MDDDIITHFRIFPEMLLAANQVRDSGMNVVGERPTINLYPLPDLVKGTIGPEVPGYSDCQGFERISHVDDCFVPVFIT